MENYDVLIAKISSLSGISKEEIELKIEAKKVKLSGLISKEGAAQIVAAELGISFENEKYKINELREGMRRANVIGKITKIFPVREFNKNGREGKVASFFLGDETSNIRTTLWDVNHISMIEKEQIKEGDSVEISGASVRKGELSLSSFSDIKRSKEKFRDVKEGAVYNEGKFDGVREGDRLKVRAFVVQSFEPRYFESKQKEGEKGALLNIVLDDGTETMRAVLFNEDIKKLVKVSDEEIYDLEKFNQKRESFIGDERIFSGTFRMNNFSSSIEMSINGIEEVDADKLIKELETKV